MFQILFILSEEGRESKKKEFTILFVPRKTLLCERKLVVSLCDYVHVRSKFVWLCACLYWWNLLLLHYWLLNLIIICFSLQELNVSFINVDEYPLELIPLDSDVLSLEMESSFKVHDWYLLSNLYWVDVAIKMQCFDNLMVAHIYLKWLKRIFFANYFWVTILAVLCCQ